jgi:hypothetical protein
MVTVTSDRDEDALGDPQLLTFDGNGARGHPHRAAIPRNRRSPRRFDVQRAYQNRSRDPPNALVGSAHRRLDRRNALPPENSSPGERLRFLLEHSGKEPADLIPVFGQRSHVNEALNGKREISAAQARKLAKLFAVKPGLFI